PPGPRALEPDMTNEFVRRFDPPTPQRIASATELLVDRAAPVLIEIVPAVGNRFGSFVGRWPHAFQSCQDDARLAQIEPGHRRFDPLDGVHRCAIVGFGHPMEVLRTVVVIEHLPGLGKQGLHMFPYPLGPITDDTQAHLLFRNDAGLFELLEGCAELLVVLDLMPTEHMDDALTIGEVETKALGIAPLPPPPRALGSRAPAPLAGLPGTVRPGWHIGPVNAEHEDRTAQAPDGHRGDASLDLLTRRRYVQHGQPLSNLVGHGGHPFAPKVHPRQ